jgi:hypothetical protein
MTVDTFICGERDGGRLWSIVSDRGAVVVVGGVMEVAVLNV